MISDDVAKSSIGDFPEKIKISGLPFMLQGWDTVFIRCVDDTGKVYYKLDNYTLYFVIDIIGVRIEKKDNKWCFIRECDYAPLYRSDYLFGDWEK